MARSKFNPETRGAVIERFSIGMNLREVAVAVDLSEQTLRGWLTRGRKAESGEYAAFARAVDDAKAEAAARPEPLTEDEHRRLVAEACRKGSVAALKLAWEMICADRNADEAEETEDPLAAIDELAERRRAAR